MTPADRLRLRGHYLLRLADRLEANPNGCDLADILESTVDRKISVKEFAFVAGVSTRTAYRWLADARRSPGGRLIINPGDMANMSPSATGPTGPKS